MCLVCDWEDRDGFPCGRWRVGREFGLIDRSYLPSPSTHTNTPTPQAAPAKKEKAAAAPKTVAAKN